MDEVRRTRSGTRARRRRHRAARGRSAAGRDRAAAQEQGLGAAEGQAEVRRGTRSTPRAARRWKRPGTTSRCTNISARWRASPAPGRRPYSSGACTRRKADPETDARREGGEVAAARSGDREAHYAHERAFLRQVGPDALRAAGRPAGAGSPTRGPWSSRLRGVAGHACWRGPPGWCIGCAEASALRDPGHILATVLSRRPNRCDQRDMLPTSLPNGKSRSAKQTGRKCHEVVQGLGGLRRRPLVGVELGRRVSGAEAGRMGRSATSNSTPAR